MWNYRDNDGDDAWQLTSVEEVIDYALEGLIGQIWGDLEDWATGTIAHLIEDDASTPMLTTVLAMAADFPARLLLSEQAKLEWSARLYTNLTRYSYIDHRRPTFPDAHPAVLVSDSETWSDADEVLLALSRVVESSNDEPS